MSGSRTSYRPCVTTGTWTRPTRTHHATWTRRRAAHVVWSRRRVCAAGAVSAAPGNAHASVVAQHGRRQSSEVGCAEELHPLAASESTGSRDRLLTWHCFLAYFARHGRPQAAGPPWRSSDHESTIRLRFFLLASRLGLERCAATSVQFQSEAEWCCRGMVQPRVRGEMVESVQVSRSTGYGSRARGCRLAQRCAGSLWAAVEPSPYAQNVNDLLRLVSSNLFSKRFTLPCANKQNQSRPRAHAAPRVV